MELKGATIEGAHYGGLTPLDFTGLQGWWRATDGITTTFSNFISEWKDISGNGRHLVPYNLATNAFVQFFGYIQNTINGTAVAGGDGNSRLVSTDPTFHKMFYDGRPITLFIVFKIRQIVTNSGYRFIATYTTVDNSIGLFSITAPTSNLAVRTLSLGVTIASNDLGTNTFTQPKGHIFSLIDMGYNAASSNLHRKTYLDNILYNERKFTHAPSTSNPTSYFNISTGGNANNHIYEILCYDNTGKTQAQILEEHNRLHNEYFNIRYPNLYS